MRKVTSSVVLAVVTAIMLVLMPNAAHTAPPTPTFGPAIDGYAAYDGQDTCDPTPKPGVVDFKDLLQQTYGSHTWGIYRDCSLGGQSEHKEGRALDYHFDVNNSTQLAKAEDLLNWLTATDEHGNQNAMARRLGLMYIIWNHQQWRAYTNPPSWQPRSCDGTPSDCHTNHIHFSFSWAGALKQTTWWTAQQPAAQSSGAVVFNGSLYEFARGSDGSVKYWFASGGPWSSVQTIGGGSVAGDPVATVFNGHLYVFARGTDGSVKYWYGNGGPWSSMQTIAGSAGSVGGAVSGTVFAGHLYVFAAGTDGSVKYWFASGGPWSSVQTIAGSAGSVGGAVGSAVFNGHLYVFGVGNDGIVRYWYGNGGPWSSMQTIGGGVGGAVSGTVFAGHLYVFARGTDGSVKYWFASGGPWSSVQTIAGSAGSVGGAVGSAVFNGHVYVFGVGTGSSVRYWFASGGPWSSMQTVGSLP